eukprot:SAG31_NODE_602_length_13638_cov_32.936037_9_plen_144_part_00
MAGGRCQGCAPVHAAMRIRGHARAGCDINIRCASSGARTPCQHRAPMPAPLASTRAGRCARARRIARRRARYPCTCSLASSTARRAHVRRTRHVGAELPHLRIDRRAADHQLSGHVHGHIRVVDAAGSQSSYGGSRQCLRADR